jgi:hypothetical protein
MDKTDITNITNKGLENIKKQYDKLSYFDNYGGSVILFILITILLVFLITSCVALSNVKLIKEDWANQRCKPYIIPIAGFINKPNNMSVNEFTKQNFVYCTQNILKTISGNALEPITFITNSSTKLLNYMKDAINDSRAMTNKMRTFFITIVKEIMGRLLNVIIPIQEIIIKFKDFAFKVQGTMVAGILSTLGIIYTLKSALKLVVKFIVTVLISLAAMITIFWLFPFTWGTAIAGTATFVALSIPLAILLTFMTKVLGINTGLSIPKLQPPPSLKCFDKNTKIKMNDGTIKTIGELEVGDKLVNNILITSKIVVESKGSIMYNLNNVVVSNSHMVNYQNKWIRVEEHPNAIKIEDYNEPYLFCINTENKIIEINNIVFTDWDEIYDDDLDKIKNVKIKNVLYNFNRYINYNIDDLIVNNLDIHRFLDGGFEKNTEIKLKNGVIKSIKHISIGDILENGERVYGYVEIDGSNLIERAIYNLAKNRFINGGSNLNICDKNMGFTSTLDLDKKYKQNKITSDCDNKLYHLLTDSKTFNINGIKFYDYNSCIDLFLEKYRGKLLSMKYV